GRESTRGSLCSAARPRIRRRPHGPRGLAAAEQRPDGAGRHYLLPSADHDHSYARARSSHVGVRFGLVIRRLIDLDTHKRKASADVSSTAGRVLADPCGEYVIEEAAAGADH